MLQRDKLFHQYYFSLKSPHGSLGPRAMPNNYSVAVTIKLFLHEWNPYSFTCHHYKWWEAPIYLTSLSWRQVACRNFPRNTVFAVVFFGIRTLLSFASDWLKTLPCINLLWKLRTHCHNYQIDYQTISLRTTLVSTKSYLFSITSKYTWSARQL